MEKKAEDGRVKTDIMGEYMRIGELSRRCKWVECDADYLWQ